ncbi:hypothetical protein, partial [Methanobrevibacter cuticularis]|uniref:hypothetical protein n=1 Tax=Methanobrevibacter cuticularis TaxID=47311 RepID=UPI000A9124AD
MKFNFKKTLIALLLFFICLSFVNSVSAATFYVNESWSNQDIQDLINNNLSISDLVFSKTGNGGYSDISLDVSRSINIVSDFGVLLNGTSVGGVCDYAFNVLADGISVN